MSVSGLPEEENIAKHKRATKVGDTTRKIMWAYVYFRFLQQKCSLILVRGAGVGLIKSLVSAREVVTSSQAQARNTI